MLGGGCGGVVVFSYANGGGEWWQKWRMVFNGGEREDNVKWSVFMIDDFF